MSEVDKLDKNCTNCGKRYGEHIGGLCNEEAFSRFVWDGTYSKSQEVKPEHTHPELDDLEERMHLERDEVVVEDVPEQGEWCYVWDVDKNENIIGKVVHAKVVWINPSKTLIYVVDSSEDDITYYARYSKEDPTNPHAKEEEPWADALPSNCYLMRLCEDSDLLTFKFDTGGTVEYRGIATSKKFNGFLYKVEPGRYLVVSYYPLWYNDKDAFGSDYHRGILDKKATLIGACMAKSEGESSK